MFPSFAFFLRSKSVRKYIRKYFASLVRHFIPNVVFLQFSIFNINIFGHATVTIWYDVLDLNNFPRSSL